MVFVKHNIIRIKCNSNVFSDVKKSWHLNNATELYIDLYKSNMAINFY